MRDTPPLPAALVDELGTLRPVRTRVPARALALALVVALPWAAAVLSLSRSPLRRDLADLPIAWLLGVGALWALGYVGSLATGLLPPRRQVMPLPHRAALWAAATVVGAFVVSLLLRHVGPHSVWAPSSAAQAVWSADCFVTAILVAACPLVVGLLALRRAVPVGERGVGAALGAAGGALGGLALHLHCAIADLPHLALGHALPVAAAALVGALAARRLLVP